MTDEDVERLMLFDGIVKNRLKIKSTITNAKLFLAIQKEFGSFYNYTLSFFPDGKPIDQQRPVIAGCSGIFRRVRCDEQGYEKARLQILRNNHLLCPFAGCGLYQRSPDGLHLSKEINSTNRLFNGALHHLLVYTLKKGSGSTHLKVKNILVINNFPFAVFITCFV